MPDFSERLKEIEAHYHDVEQQLSAPDVVRDQKRYADLMRMHRDMGIILEASRECDRLGRELAQARELVNDPQPEIADMAREEIGETTQTLSAAEERLKLLLLPRDPNDERNTIIEIRAGTGGEEAALFAGDLLRMYSRYSEIRGWRTELLSASESDLGGFKEVIFSVQGEGTYSRLKYEGGTHRVQRVPVTETQGRIHTSAVTVAVMPEAEEVDVEIKPQEIRVDVFRSSGPGGQSVNTTDSAVRITHLPTGLVVSCQDEKSQLKNKNKALKVLRSRLLERYQRERDDALSAQRRLQVGSGDRSERIRTYNFPQNRLTDHRINLTLYNLDQILEGQIEPVIQGLISQAQSEQLKSL